MGIGYGSSHVQGLILLIASSMLAVSLAKTAIVGGSEGWHVGFNYANWTCQNGPFFLHDTLVFKYDRPSATVFAHSVYQFPNYQSFQKCDLKKAKKVANQTAGAGKGFHFKLNKLKPYFFACGERDGDHCKSGLMKFFVNPLPASYCSLIRLQ